MSGTTLLIGYTCRSTPFPGLFQIIASEFHLFANEFQISTNGFQFISNEFKISPDEFQISLQSIEIARVKSLINCAVYVFAVY